MNTYERDMKKTIGLAVMIMAISIGMVYLPTPSILIHKVGEQNAIYIKEIMLQTTIGMILCRLHRRWNLQQVMGLRVIGQKIYLVWPAFFYIGLNAWDLLCGQIQIDYSRGIMLLLFCGANFAVGFFEESLCRGMVLGLFYQRFGASKMGVYKAVIGSSILFGSAHMIHYCLGHSSFIATITQVIYATFIGVFMGAITIRTKSLLPAVIFHGMIDLHYSILIL